MSLNYYIKSQTTGDNDSVSQVLTQNCLATKNSIFKSDFFSFDYPVYTIEGASLNYYEKDYNSISFDITNGKVYSLVFSASTIQSLTGDNSISHVLYRIKNTDYEAYVEDPVNNGYLISNSLNTPFISIEEYWSAITLNGYVYTYSFPTQYKEVGGFTFDIFDDRDQFLLDSVIGFDVYNDLTLGDAYAYLGNTDQNGIPIPTRVFLDPSATTRTYSNLGQQTITGNSIASGYTFQGAFFTYFVPPKKPNLYVSGGDSSLSVEGLQNSISPIFNFNNTDDGDYYQLQVNYDTSDIPFSGNQIYTYTINSQAGDAEYVRTFSTPLKANDSFIYRIGNTKEVNNLFGTRQTITTWTDAINAQIQSTGLYIVSGTTWKNMVSNKYFGYYRMSGITVGAETSSSKNYSVTTSLNSSIPLNTCVASTNGSDTITIDYSGSVTTLQWQQAIYAAAGFSQMNMYVIGGSSLVSPINASDFTFTINTVSHRLSGVSITLKNVFNSTALDLGIDLRSSESVVVPITVDYTDTSTGQQSTRVSDLNGYFGFGGLAGGYYQLIAQPTGPPINNLQLKPISQYITINSNTNLDLVFSILWGNKLTEGFTALSNEIFL